MSELQKWQEAMGLTRRDAYQALGLADKTYRRYVTGEKVTPLYVRLACAALQNGIDPISDSKPKRKRSKKSS